jgi:hypothetical protein
MATVGGQGRLGDGAEALQVQHMVLAQALAQCGKRAAIWWRTSTRASISITWRWP